MAALERRHALIKRKESNRFQDSVHYISEQLQNFNPKMARLRDLDLFVLDNSIRETTVGQLRGHTLEDKWAIYEEVKKSGFKYCVVESFNHMTRLGDVFLQQLKETGEDMTSMFAFTEFVEVIDEQKVPQEDVPIGLLKSKRLGVQNVVMEIDLVYHGIDYKLFNARVMCELLLKRLQWIYVNLSFDSKVFINIRDYSDCMNYYPARVFRLVNFIGKLPKETRPFGILYEELGKYLPEEVAVWTRATRREMDNCGWMDGHLLVHVHEQWGMSDSTQLECLANGANGIWAGLCDEGAALGHASSCITIMNLIRLGNEKVIEKFNCSYLREGAQNVTKITTGSMPHSRAPVYGARALDIVFGLDKAQSRWDFNFTEFLGISPEIRITTLAAPEMIVSKLIAYFGNDKQFTFDIGLKMKKKLLENLRNNRKEESDSKVGLAMLFDQSGGKMTPAMAKVIDEDKCHSAHIEELIKKIREKWNMWDISDGVKDDQLTFDAFYNGFMAPYFGCYRCEDTRRGLHAIDMDNDGQVDWKEFALYLKWAGRQYPETRTVEELIDIAFRKGLIPAMQDVILNDEVVADRSNVANGGGRPVGLTRNLTSMRRKKTHRKIHKAKSDSTCLNGEKTVVNGKEFVQHNVGEGAGGLFYDQDVYDNDDTFLEGEDEAFVII